MVPILAIILTTVFAVKEMWAAMTIVLVIGLIYTLLVNMKD